MRSLPGASRPGVLDMIGPRIAAGMTTAEVDRICQLALSWTSRSSDSRALELQGVSRSICTLGSTTPSATASAGDKVLKAGDILNVDASPSSRTASTATPAACFLIGSRRSRPGGCATSASEAMWRGHPRRGPTRARALGDLGHTHPGTSSRRKGYSVVREYCGHGIGRVFHARTRRSLHYGELRAPAWRSGRHDTRSEPMVNAGRRHVKLLGDGWTVVTKGPLAVGAMGAHGARDADGLRSADARRGSIMTAA